MNRFILVVLAGILLQGCRSTENVEENEKDLTIFVASDLHYLAKELYVDGDLFQNYIDSSDGKMTHYMDEILAAFLQDISKKKPEILIISGDLTNNGEKISHIKLAEMFEEVEQKTGTKIFVIPGNHDLVNPWARGFTEQDQYITETIGPDEFAAIYKEFGYGDAIFRDETTLSYLAAASDTLWLLMLDTNIYDFNELMGSPTTNGDISEETLQWIRKCREMAKKEGAEIIVGMHHNLLNHSEVLNAGFTLDNKEEVLKAFQENDFKLVLSGHVHIQDIKAGGEREKKIYDIASGALSVYPVQYGVIRYNESLGFDYSTERVNVEEWGKESYSSNNEILHFDEYAKEYFTKISYGKAYEALADNNEYSEQQKREMAETMSLLNVNYFAGTTDFIKQSVMETQGYQLWLSAIEPKFLKEYVKSMLSENEHNDNAIQIPILVANHSLKE